MERRKSIRRWTIAGIALVLVATLAVAATYTPLFAAKHIRLRGYGGISRAEILSVGGVDDRSNVFHLDTRAVERRLEDDPRVLEARVITSLPDMVSIEIVPRTPVAVLGRPAVLVGADGVVIGPAGHAVDLPKLVDGDGAAVASHPRDLGLELVRVDDRRRGARLERAGIRAAKSDENLADRRAVVGDAPAHPLAGPEEVVALDLREVLDAERPRHGQVDRLTAGRRQPLEVRLRELDELAAVREPQQHRAGLEAAALAALLDQALALERPQQARRGALRERGIVGELGERARPLGLQHQRQELGGAVDRLRAR